MDGNSGSSIVLNKQFLRWELFIRRCLEADGFGDISDSCNPGTGQYPEREQILNYDVEPLKSIYKECMDHAVQRNKKLHDEVLILMHPTFMFQQGMHYLINDDAREQADAYWDNLTSVLNSRRPDVSFAITETVQHYASTTSLWLEQGRIDAAAFTKYNSGIMMTPGFIRSLKGKKVFVGGMYNYFCVTALLAQIRKEENIEWYIIKDLIVDQPSKCDQINPTTIWQGTMDITSPERLVSLERLLK